MQRGGNPPFRKNVNVFWATTNYLKDFILQPSTNDHVPIALLISPTMIITRTFLWRFLFHGMRPCSWMENVPLSVEVVPNQGKSPLCPSFHVTSICGSGNGSHGARGHPTRRAADLTFTYGDMRKFWLSVSVCVRTGLHGAGNVITDDTSHLTGT